MGGKVRLALVGCGFMGQAVHLPNFLKARGCEVVAVCELREKLGRAVAERYRIPRYYRSHRDLMDASDIDAAAVVTPDDLHAPITVDLLSSGKHVFVEKPMATNVEDAQTMVRASEASGKLLMVAYMKRYDEGVLKAKEILDNLVSSGELGEITFVRVHDFGGDWICGYDEPVIATDEPYPEVRPRPPKWLPESEVKRFYVFNNVFCHDINLLRFLLGDPREVKFATFRGDYHISVLGYDDFDVSFETGNISARFWDEEIKVYFRHGWLEIKLPPPLLRNVPASVEIYKAGKMQKVEIPYAGWSWAFRNEAQHFIDCVLEGKEPRSSGRDSLKDVMIAEAIYKCFLEGKSVKFAF
jgi:predicted dehydrogenase